MRQAQKSAVNRFRLRQSGFSNGQSRTEAILHTAPLLMFVVLPADGKELSLLQLETHNCPYSRLVDDVRRSFRCDAIIQYFNLVFAPGLSTLPPFHHSFHHPTSFLYSILNPAAPATFPTCRLHSSR